MFYFLILIWFLFSIAKVCHSNNELCSKIKTNIEIATSFRFGQYSVLFTKNIGVYRFKGLHFDGKKLTYESVTEWQDWYGKHSRLQFITHEIMHMFDMKYPNNTVRIFTTTTVKRHNVNYFTTYAIGINNDVNAIEFVSEVTIDPYNYVHRKDSLNLKSIFEKFPQRNIEYYLMALMSFPYNDQQMPKRLIVYYEEKKPKSSELVTKVHILRQTTITLPEMNETNWKRDEKSGNCFETSHVSSVLRISDYENNDSGSKYFFMVEFKGQNYDLKKVMLTSDGETVTTPFTTVYSDIITRLFGCVPISPSTDSIQTTNFPPEEESESEYWVLLTLVIIFGILSFASVGYLIYLFYKFLKLQ